MRADEFCMFIHGPFATNIHIDARQVQNLKTVIARRPLSLAEFCILKSLFSSNKQLRTGEDLVKHLKQKTKITSSEVYSVLKNLVESTPFVERRTNIIVGSTGNSNAGFLKNLQGSRYAKSVVGTKLLKRFSKDFYSLSQAGRDKLENTLRDKTHKDYFEKINPHSEVDIANASDVTRTALDDFWAEIDAERNIDSYSFSKRAFLDQEEEVSFFSDED